MVLRTLFETVLEASFYFTIIISNCMLLGRSQPMIFYFREPTKRKFVLLEGEKEIRSVPDHDYSNDLINVIRSFIMFLTSGVIDLQKRTGITIIQNDYNIPVLFGAFLTFNRFLSHQTRMLIRC